MAYVSLVLRFLFAWIDKIVIWVIEQLYNLLISLSNLTVFSDQIITTLAKRLAILIGIIFLFRAAFAMVQYIVNPDKMNDNSNGASKVVTNVIISLILMLSYNFIFKQAYILQGKILGINYGENCEEVASQGVLEKIIFGVGNLNTTANIKSAGQSMAYAMYTAFVYPNPDVIGDACENVYTGNTRNNRINDNVSKCNEALEKAGVSLETRTIFFKAISNQKAGELVDYDILTDMSPEIDENGRKTGSETNTFAYFPIISTVCAGFVCVILFNFCIDVAIRMVKLGFLQLIAPIPILSNMVPGQKNMLSNWAKECGKAYVSLFIRLSALYFAIFVIMAVLNTGIFNVVTGCKVGFMTNPIAVILIILGALIFAQQVPKLISAITGVSLDGDFTLNPMKKIGQSPYAAAAVGAVGGGLAGLASNAYAFGRRRYQIGKKGLGERSVEENDFYEHGLSNGFKTIFGGLGSGSSRGLLGGLKSGGKGSAWDSVKSALSASNQARTDRQAIRKMNIEAKSDDEKYGFFQRNFVDPMDRTAGYKNSDAGLGSIDKKIKKLAREMENNRSSEDAARIQQENFLATSPFTESEFKNMDNYVDKHSDLLNKNYNDLSDDEKKIYNSLTKYKKDINLFNAKKAEWDKYQDRIDELDEEYEKLRQEKGRLEDAQRRYAEQQSKKS